MDRDSQRFIEAERFRKALAAREASALRFMERAWQVSMTKLQKDIDKITAKIDKARLAGERVNRDWLRRQAEWKRLQSQIIREANQYSAVVAERLKNETAWAARTGAANASTLTQLSFAEPIREVVSFGTLSSDSVQAIAARVTPRSPTGKLLGKLGRDAAREARLTLIDGITRGKNVRVIARDLEKAANLPKSRALTIARTEIFSAYTDASHRQMQEDRAVVKAWVWNCNLASACGGCLAMHGKEFPVDEFMKKHPNCHCEPMPVPKSWKDLGIDLPEDFFESVNPAGLDPDSLDLEVDAFNPARMKREAAEEIKNKSLEDLQKRFGKGKGELIHKGKVELDDLATVVPSKIWGGATTETPLKNLI